MLIGLIVESFEWVDEGFLVLHTQEVELELAVSESKGQRVRSLLVEKEVAVQRVATLVWKVQQQVQAEVDKQAIKGLLVSMLEGADGESVE